MPVQMVFVFGQHDYLRGNNLRSFRFESKLSTWIAKISYNTCLKHLRKKKIILSVTEFINGNEPAEDDTMELIFSKERLAIIKTEVEKMPILYKTLLTLYHTEELNYAEIMQITGLPAGTVKSYLFRARKILRDNLLLNYKREAL